ncbi:MAG: phosphomannose isomerase type II C-terminal cupin domain [Cyanobacteriota bacterium]|nr:phosphomannose isomerase type II C-terminal cupin domain [Cyanobacteriota bacterium]
MSDHPSTGIPEILRPYGKVTVLEEGSHYRIKRVVIDPHPVGQMTYHLHHHRSEHWIVVAGTVLVVCDDCEQLVTTGQSTYVPPCTPHRLINPGVLPAQLVEIQNGEYLGEDDMQVVDFEAYRPVLP